MYGASGVGKTSITLQFVRNEFSESYIPTIEDTFEKNVEVNGKTYDLELVDTAGQEDFKDMRARSVNDCDGFIIVYATDDENSLNYITEMYNEIVSIRGEKYSNRIVIAGNKCDLPQPFAVTLDKAQQMSLEHWGNKQVLETSAKTGENIDELYKTILKIIISEDAASKAQPSEKSNDGGCCNIQ